MHILAFDTATSSGAVAVVRDNTVLAQWQGAREGAHAVTLMPAVDSVLKEAGLRIADIDCFAVGVGPGSFTGLRIGISAVKGLSWTLDKKVVAVSSLKAIAMNLKEESALICPILDAKKKEVYTSLYRFKDDEMETLMHETVIKPSELFSMIKSGFGPRDVVFIGEGLDVYKDLLEREIEGARLGPEALWQVSAVNIAALAMSDMEKAVLPWQISPKYLRKSEAETKRRLD
ncbi:MAG: tRNA (adenosine(37)-N6)-threonylcarbamoyltransferase complex dimerization subunit type 1 TsaB [Deltaproteobacteria bacterium]|nr:tRNA (adenosine(37)-N6)-threonylcarbamoyltransferase complex dimerization subunit type 1 TsaB [Deltaproteobacteria bacterium]